MYERCNVQILGLAKCGRLQMVLDAKGVDPGVWRRYTPVDFETRWMLSQIPPPDFVLYDLCLIMKVFKTTSW